MRVLLVLAAALLVACPGEPPPAPRPSAPAPPPSPPPAVRADGRLPGTALPTHYALDLEIDPNAARFSGAARIDVQVKERTRWLVLHGRHLEVTAAKVNDVAARVSTRASQGGKEPEELLVELERPLEPGAALLSLAWTAPFDEGLAGLYRVREGGLSYAFTQFEPTDARRAFPCFDEPSIKVPFDVSITVPRPMIAVANAPEAAREDVDASRTRFRFAPTPPLPTYLVALAVGELDVKEATRFTRPPVRIVTTKGKTTGAKDLTSLALEATSGLVDALGEWFAIPYPYAKLDVVAVPEFRSGAMENAGLVTFREERLLVDAAHGSAEARRAQALVIAHELAHQWFGDLVTAAWWNDLWLNEGMATWMEWRILDKWRPSLGGRVDALVEAHGVMDTDGLVSARAVRQPVVTTGDAQSAFDGITYQKGAAVLGTIERWIGEERFQRGVRDYVGANAWKSADAGQLFAALDRASGKDVTQMASTFLDQPGVPEVTAHLECTGGNRWHLELGAEPWRPLGAKAPTDETNRAWTIPACVRVAGEKAEACADLVAGAPSLVAGRGCPAWIHPNVGGAYYRFTLTEKELVKLAGAPLDAGARVSLLSNAWAAVRSGQLDAKAMLRVLPLLDDDGSRHVTEEVARILAAMSDALVLDEARPAFRKFAQARLAKRKKDDPLARRAITLAMADVVEDEATLREAEEPARRWLAEPTSVAGDVGAVAMDLASRRAGEARFTALRDALRTARSREDRTVVLKALYGFEGEADLVRALDLSVTDEVRGGELRYVWNAVFGRRKARPIAEAWVRTHWDELRRKLPGRLSMMLVRAASVGCSAEEAEQRAAFYGPRAAAIEGAERGLAEALESVTLCAALREKNAASLRNGLLGRK